MQVEISISKDMHLPSGALEALHNEFSKRLHKYFEDIEVRIKRGPTNLSVLGGLKTDKDLISDLLQETWESADDWFSPDEQTVF